MCKKIWEYNAVAAQNEVYCAECCPEDLQLAKAISPMEEWDNAPKCAACGTVHDYMIVLSESLENYDDEALPIAA